jgi:hypothetical protein
MRRDYSVSALGGGPVIESRRPLAPAREELQRFDRMVQKFPANAALNRARLMAYAMWLQAVRNFRNAR